MPTNNNVLIRIPDGSGSNISAWTSDTAYTGGQMVYFEDSIYLCEVSHTSSSSFLDDIDNWRSLGGGSSSLIGLNDTPNTLPASNVWVLTLNDDENGFGYRRLKDDAFFTLTIDSFSVRGNNQAALERGRTATSLRFQWTVNDSSHGGAAVITGDGGPFNLTFSGTSGDQTVSASVTDPGGGAQASRVYTISIDGETRTATLYWRYRIYYGWISSGSLPSESTIESLTNSLQSNKPNSVTISGNSGTRYAFYCQPSSFTTPSTFRDLDTGFEISMQYLGAVLVTNSYGVAEYYDVWRTANPTSLSTLRLGVE